MTDDRWQMADGRWPMADGRWQMADGRWQMADGRWQMAAARRQHAADLTPIPDLPHPPLRGRARFRFLLPVPNDGPPCGLYGRADLACAKACGCARK